MKNRPWLPLIILLGIAIRLVFFHYRGLHLDELPEVMAVLYPSSTLSELWDHYRLSADSQAFPYRVIQFVFQLLFGKNQIAYTWPTLIAGVLEIPLTYWLARRLSTERTALYAAFFNAVSALHIFYATGPRSYPFFYCASIVFLVGVMELHRSLASYTGKWATALGAAMLLAANKASLFLMACSAFSWGVSRPKTREFFWGLFGLAMVMAWILRAQLGIWVPLEELYGNFLEAITFPFLWQAYHLFEPKLLTGHWVNAIWYPLILLGVLGSVVEIYLRRNQKLRPLADLFVLSVAFDSLSHFLIFRVEPHHVIFKDFLIFFFVARLLDRGAEALVDLKKAGLAWAALILPVLVVAFQISQTQNYFWVVEAKENLFLTQAVGKKSVQVIGCVGWTAFPEDQFNYPEEVRTSNLLEAQLRGIPLIDACQCEAFVPPALPGDQRLIYVSSSRAGRHLPDRDACFKERIVRAGWGLIEQIPSDRFPGDYTLFVYAQK